MKFPFLTIEMETTPYNNFSEHEIRIIDEITITLAIAYNDYLKAYEKSSTIMKTYHKLTSSKKKIIQSFYDIVDSKYESGKWNVSRGNSQ